jgi:hypothetical protein
LQSASHEFLREHNFTFYKVEKIMRQPATMFGTRDDDDVIFLLLTIQFPLIASLLYMADKKLFLAVSLL